MFQITDVRISLNPYEKTKLRAVASMTLDNVFVVKDIKVIDGRKGLFVAMPCTQITKKCRGCKSNNPVSNKFCANCGKEFKNDRRLTLVRRKEDYRDIAHPICKDCRKYIEDTIVSAYKQKNSSSHITRSA